MQSSPSLAACMQTTIEKHVSRETLKADFLSAQLAGDRARALSVILDAVRSGLSPRELQLHVIAGAQREIGRMWELNQVSIAQEHLATAIAQLALAQLYGHGAVAAPTGWTVLLACVEGEMHDLGPRIAADVLEAEGYDVRFLGANVPTESLVDLASRMKPDVICLSATMLFHLPALRQAVKAVREALPDVHLLAGGWAVEQVGQAPEGSLRAGVSAEELVSVLASLQRSVA
jgi:methanogenic corrinoid protein MtbC1